MQLPAPAFQPQALSEEMWGFRTEKEHKSYPAGFYDVRFMCQWQPKAWSPVLKAKQESLKSLPWQSEP